MDYRDAFTQAAPGKPAGGSGDQPAGAPGGQTGAQPAPAPSGEKTVREVLVVIPDRFTAQEVGEVLAKGGLVTSAADFVARVKEANLTTSLAAGVYRFREGTKVDDIIEAMIRKQ